MNQKQKQILISGGFREEDYLITTRPGRVTKAILGGLTAFLIVSALVLAPVVAALV